MSNNLVGIQYTANYNNLDGLSVIDADELFIGGNQVDITNLVPYTGATKTINLGSQNIQTTHVATAPNDLVNVSVLQSAVAYIDTSVANTFLNKITTTGQTVAGYTTFSGGMEANQNSRFNSMTFMTPDTIQGWNIDVSGSSTSGPYDMTFSNVQTSETILFKDTGKIQCKGYIDTNATASKVAIFNGDKELVSSGVDASKIDYLDNVSSDIQTQLNAKIDRYGDTMSGDLDMGTNYVLMTATPTDQYQGANKKYVDNQVETRVSKTGDTISGELTVNAIVNVGNRLLGTPDSNPGNFWIGLKGTGTEAQRLAIAIVGNQTTGVVSNVAMNYPLSMGSNKITSSATPSTGDDLCNKTYVDSISGSGSWSLSGTDLYNTNTGKVRIGGGTTFPNLLTIGNAPSGYFDAIGWDRTTNQPSISMGTNHIAYASNAGSWASDAEAGDMILRTDNKSIRFNTDNGGYSQFTVWKEGTTEVYGRGYSTALSDTYCFRVRCADSFNGNGATTVYSRSIELNAGDLTWSGGNRSYGARIYIGGGYSVNASLNHAPIVFYTANAERMRVAPSGYVGINTSSPLSRFTIKSNYSGGQDDCFCIDANDGSVYNLRLFPYVQASSQVGYKFKVNNVASSNDALSIAYNGNIGLGNDSPAYRLEVSAGDASKARFGPNASWGAYLLVGSGTNEVGSITAQVLSTNGNLHLDGGIGKDIYLGYYANQGGGANNIYSIGNWNHSSNFGIGMTPVYKLDVSGTARATDGIITNNMIVQNFIGAKLNTPQYRIHASQSAGWITGSSAHATGLIGVGGGNNLVDDQTIVFPNPATTDGVVSGLNWWSPDFVISRYKNNFFLGFKEIHGGALGNATKDIMRAYVYDSGGYSYLSYLQFLGEDNAGGATAGFGSYYQRARVYALSPGNQSANTGTWGQAEGISVGCNIGQTSQVASINMNMYRPGGTEDQNNYIGTITSLRPGVAWLTLYISAANTYMFYYGTNTAYLGGGGWVNLSDEREKEDIQPLNTSRSLEKVLASKPYNYRIKYPTDETKAPIPDEVRNKRHIGLLAQEQLETNPHCVSTWKKDEEPTEDDNKERYGLAYHDYTVHLIGAVQEIVKQIDAQKTKIDTLESSMMALIERDKLIVEHARLMEEDLKNTKKEFAEYKALTEERLNKLASLIQQLMK